MEKGGSYIRNEDGSLTLVERTREPGEIINNPADAPGEAGTVQAKATDKKKGGNHGA